MQTAKEDPMPGNDRPTLLSLDQAEAVATSSDNFIRKEGSVDGFRYKIFNYVFPTYGRFFDEKRKINMFEMRGLTFVADSKGENPTTFTRNLMLHKFFTVNQVEETQFKRLAKLPITSVSEKIDGSMIRFIRLPDGKTVAKTKMSFEAEQAVAATSMYESSEKLKALVNESLSSRVALIFEYTSSENQIVVKHGEAKLTLLQARDEKSGRYLSLEQFDWPAARAIAPAPTFEKLMALKKTEDDVEGWVVRFGNLFVKVKTDWYARLHSVTANLRAHDVAKMVIEDKADDLFGSISEEHPMYETARKIEKELTKHISSRLSDAKDLAEKAKAAGKSGRKQFAKAHKGKEDFDVAMTIAYRNLDDGLKKLRKKLLTKAKKKVWEEFAAKNLDL